MEVQRARSLHLATPSSDCLARERGRGRSGGQIWEGGWRGAAWLWPQGPWVGLLGRWTPHTVAA